MSNGELLRGLLDIAGFGWMLLDCRMLLGYCSDIAQIVQNTRILLDIAQNCRILQNIVQVLRARPTQGITHSTIAITLPLIVSRKGWLTQPQPSPLPLFYSL